MALSSCIRDFPDETIAIDENNTGFKESRTVSGVVYQLYYDNTAVCTGIDEEHSFNFYDELILPEKVNDRFRLIKIADSAFEGSRFEQIRLPDTIEYIGNRAFRRGMLKKINIPESVRSIGEEAFDNCRALEKIDFKANISEIPIGMFFSCEKLIEIELPESIKIIREDAFAQCTSLEKVGFPEALEKIEEYAFYDCPKLKTEIPQVS